ncbi:MAG TPA: tetratricopeptide repeat protein, partial [Tangfeifania sp.]|nr:tetratricopeptide repeat protein [Tangfeifania sp.]
VMSYIDQNVDKKDPYLDKAQQFLDKAFKIAPRESELFALQAFLYPSRITVDPMARGMEYMGKMNAALDKAIELNPENPRSYYLRAITLLNMPEQFGGGAKVARPLFETAKEKFDKFEPASPIHPDWGKEINEMEMQKL